MKTLLLLSTLSILSMMAMAQDKKALKAISKAHGEYDQGKIYSKNKSVAILGANLRFRVAARAVETTSHKAATTAKFESFATLDGIDDGLLQSITDEYYSLLTQRFTKLGLTVMDQDKIRQSKSWAKLKDKGTKDKENVVKSWGVAKIFTPNNQDYVTWNNAAPFGPHTKVAKEMKAILYSALTTVDFCYIDMTAKSTASVSGNYKSTYTEGTATVVPAINIHGYTYPLKGVKMMEDNTYGFGISPAGKQHNTIYTGNVSSAIDYATKVEKCASCEPEFTSKFKLMSHGLGTVVVTADPAKFKAAVLDALNKYLDEVFALYAAQL